VDKPDWPIGIHHVPYTLSIALDKGDVETAADGSASLVRFQGKQLQTGSELLVLVRGTVPELGTDMIQEQWYRIPDDLRFGKFYHIDVDYQRPSRTWKGWERFEESEPFDRHETVPGIVSRRMEDSG
jgi:hypothetical protein